MKQFRRIVVKEILDLIESARKNNKKALSEYDSKQVISAYGIPVVAETMVDGLGGAQRAAKDLAYPVVLKLCSEEITHKTEKGLIQLDLRNDGDVEEAFKLLTERCSGDADKFLVQKMIKGERELVIGMTRDPQFGPCVMFGMGGIFTEILADVSFRVAPLNEQDALEMMKEIRGHRILDAIRGLKEVDREIMVNSLMALGRIGLEHDAIQSIDVNPLVITDGRPVAVDALVSFR
ncbi:MAG: acetate--CoA ligase family protein [Deltaproteobacteria bacterium]|jgi:acetyl-CoA synthetase (ADP-forming)|nr:acetate--CoA ligase family protein [Deltaproteobacteria bacterium]